MREFESSPELDETEQPGILAVLAERVGFEPTVAQRATTVFETVPFNRSGTSPGAVSGVPVPNTGALSMAAGIIS